MARTTQSFLHVQFALDFGIDYAEFSAVREELDSPTSYNTELFRQEKANVRARGGLTANFEINVIVDERMKVGFENHLSGARTHIATLNGGIGACNSWPFFLTPINALAMKVCISLTGLRHHLHPQ